MAAVATATIQQLLDEVEFLKKLIETAGAEGRARLQEILVADVRTAVTGPSGKVDDAVWTQRPEDEQVQLRHRLVQVRDSLRVAAGIDGPMDPGHIMYGEYASNFAIVLSTAISFLLVIGLLYGVVTRWGVATGTDLGRSVATLSVALADLDAVQRRAATVGADSLREAQQDVDAAQRRVILASAAAVNATGADERMILLMVTLLGALGGSLHLVGSLVKYIGNRQLKRSWLLYYLSLPLAGAALAPIVYMLLRVGILTPSGTASGGAVAADLNLIGIYAFAALTGMFAKTATDKLGEVFATIFRTPAGTRDPLGAERPGGG